MTDDVTAWLRAKIAEYGFEGARIEDVRASEQSGVVTLVFVTDPADALQLAMKLLSALSGRNSYEFNIHAGRVIITFDGPPPWAAAAAA